MTSVVYETFFRAGTTLKFRTETSFREATPFWLDDATHAIAIRAENHGPDGIADYSTLQELRFSSLGEGSRLVVMSTLSIGF